LLALPVYITLAHTRRFLGGVVSMSLLFGTNRRQYATVFSLPSCLAGGHMLGGILHRTIQVGQHQPHKGSDLCALGHWRFGLHLIRSWGNYPGRRSGFSAVLMNFCGAFIDYYTPPRTYGHTRLDAV